MFLSLLVFTSLHFSAFSCHPPEIVNTLKIYHFSKHLICFICFINGTVEKNVFMTFAKYYITFLFTFYKGLQQFWNSGLKYEVLNMTKLEIYKFILLFNYLFTCMVGFV